MTLDEPREQDLRTSGDGPSVHGELTSQGHVGDWSPPSQTHTGLTQRCSGSQRTQNASKYDLEV